MALAHENRADLDRLIAGLRDEFKPQGEHENFLVDQMIRARWALNRIDRLECVAFDQILTEPGSPADPDARILAALGSSGNIIDKLQRWANSCRRTYSQAKHELESSRERTARTQANAFDNYIKQVVFAPLPGQDRVAKRVLQNEPNPPSATSNANLALRL